MSAYFFRLRTASIRSHLFMLALGTLLPVVLFAAGLAIVQARQERQTFERGMHDRVVGVTSAIDAEVRATVASLRTLAESQVLVDGDLERFHDVALRVKNLHRDWVTVMLDSADGQRLVNATQPYGVELFPIKETSSFEAVLRTLQPAIGGLSLGPSGLRQAFPVRVPVLHEGRLAYVLTAVVDPVAISRLLSEQEMPNDWVVSVVDLGLVQVVRMHQGQVQVGVQVAAAFRAALTSGASQGAYRGATLEGTPSYVTWRRSAYSGWTVGVGVPAVSVEASARQALIFSLWGVGVSLALALLLAWLLARRISEPVALLAAQARALRRGDYSLSQQIPKLEASGRPPVEKQAEPIVRALPDCDTPESTGLVIPELRELQQALDDAAHAMHALSLARAQAEGANRAKDEFLAMLGHELRNPLSAITTALQLLRMEPEGASGIFAQGVLQRQTAHLTKLVNDLLDASRVSRGKIELERRLLDFAALVQRVAVQVVASSPKHQLDQRLDAAWVLGDETRLEQIVTNLLSNAVRYSPDGGTIQLVLTQVAALVQLTVRDEGIGIPAELLPRMFDLFVQGERGAARTQGGLGIGLTLAHRLAELHAGRLDAHSEGEGQGSTFTLTLPSAEARVATAPLMVPVDTQAARRLNVLLVDDHDDGRRMLRKVLQSAGHRVTEAVDGPQALEMASAGAFDVALIDIGLPGMDGLEVARTLRHKGPRLATTLLVAITGYGSPEDYARSRAAGFDLHVVKPVDGIDLLEQVQRLLLQAR